MRRTTAEITPLFEVSVYALACFASAVLATGEGAVFPAGLTIPLALLAWYFNERTGRWSLSAVWTNVLGIIALAVAVFEFFGDDLEAKLLSGAHLLVYIAWILFFQKKEPRQFWWLCALGVLQVAVASVLTDEGTFGLLLVGYLFLAIWTLSVFSLHISHQMFEQAGQTSPPIRSSSEHRADGPILLSAMASSGANNGIAQQFAVLRRRQNETYGTIQHDPRQPFIGARFVIGIVGTACLSLLVGVCFFVLIPRVWFSQWPAFNDRPEPGVNALTGFTSEVQLGDIGEILESTEPVLQMRLFDNETNEELDAATFAASLGYDEPLFRGAVLDIYDQGRWSSRRLRGERTVALATEPAFSAIVRQDIKMTPIGTQTLFAMQPVVACRLKNRFEHARIGLMTSVLRRNDRIRASEPLDYAVYSLKEPKNDLQVYELNGMDTEVMRRGILFRDLQIPPGLEQLKALAEEVSGIGSAERAQTLQIAKRLESFLRNSGQFGYSLDVSIQDPTIDPVEDFLFNRKEGHCEYFASALALMLRSVGIPARLVSGFKGGSVNALSGRFVVEQRHAHVWVEAHIEGKWTVLDATPGERAVSVDSMESALSSWHDFMRIASDFWSAYVVGISLHQQQNSFYSPLRDGAEYVWETVRETGSQASRNVTGFLDSPLHWFTWRGIGVVFAWVILLSAIDWLLRRHFGSTAQFPNILILLANLFTRHLGDHAFRDTAGIEFYERFQSILARHGLMRRSSQTQREFAQDVQSARKQVLADAGLAEFPTSLADRFYGVRFGTVRLAPEEAKELDRLLERMEQCLQMA